MEEPAGHFTPAVVRDKSGRTRVSYPFRMAEFESRSLHKYSQKNPPAICIVPKAARNTALVPSRCSVRYNSVSIAASPSCPSPWRLLAGNYVTPDTTEKSGRSHSHAGAQIGSRARHLPTESDDQE